ncbi:hypothetical protein K449DRAFT_393545 [Hypoxylon sp. EC38]|nr:hypothetical protein K449DRAFT_393545 [Hypoxylon sp. EC38]
MADQKETTSSKWVEDDGPGTFHGFAVPDPNFDPTNTEYIREYYKKKEERGALNPEDGIEDDVEAEAMKVVAEWEKVEGREATEEERNRMMEKVRRIRRGNWLEGAKTQLVGKTEVPIAWFNRLVAENEACIGYVAKQMASVSKERQEMYTTIKDLRTTIKELEEGKFDANGAVYKGLRDELDKLRTENFALVEQNTKLQNDLAKAPLKLENDEVQSRIERLQAELNESYRQRQERDERITFLETQQDESRQRERALKEQAEKQDKRISDLIDQDFRSSEIIKLLNDERDGFQKRLTREKDEFQRQLTQERDQFQRQLKNIQKGNGSTPANPTDPAGLTGTNDTTGSTGDFDTMAVLREIKRASEADSEVSAEAKQLIDRWLSRVADKQNLQEFHTAVSEFRDNMAALQKRVVDFYKTLGAADDNIDAGEVLNRLEAHLKEQPKDDPLKMVVWGLKQQCEIQLKDQKLQVEDLKNQTLRVELEMAKSDEQIETEMKMAYNIFNDEELGKRVDSRTQVFRQHRREMLDNLFGAATTLTNIALRCPDERTRRDIQQVMQQYLNPISLPGPSAQPPR